RASAAELDAQRPGGQQAQAMKSAAGGPLIGCLGVASAESPALHGLHRPAVLPQGDEDGFRPPEQFNPDAHGWPPDHGCRNRRSSRRHEPTSLPGRIVARSGAGGTALRGRPASGFPLGTSLGPTFRTTLAVPQGYKLLVSLRLRNAHARRVPRWQRTSSPATGDLPEAEVLRPPRATRPGHPPGTPRRLLLVLCQQVLSGDRRAGPG